MQRTVMTHIFVTVEYGVANVDMNTVPEDTVVHIIDYENLETIPVAADRRAVLSYDEIEYIEKHRPSLLR